MLTDLFHRLRALLKPSTVAREIDEELRFHVDRQVESYVKAGLSRTEAARRARLEFGGLDQIKEECGDALGVRFVDELFQDVRYALRGMARNRGFAATALATLTVGISMATTVFSVVDNVLIKPLPYPAADRLVRVWEEHPGGTSITSDRWITNRTFWAWLERPRTIDVLGGSGTYEYNVTLPNDTLRMFGAEVSPQLLGAVGANAMLGRLFANGESEQGADRVVLLSEGMWRDLFGADSHIVGRTIRIDDEPRTVVGVVARSFFFPDRRARFWLPYVVPHVSTDPKLSQGTSGLTAIARLAPGVTAQQAEAEGTAAARSVPVTMSTELLFGKGGPPVVHVVPLLADATATVRPALWVLAAGAGCILLIACANVANLLLSRGIARERELAVRTAIGAGRARLTRQLITEASVYAAAGASAGIAVTWGLVRLLPTMAPTRFPRLEDIQVDARVLAVASASAIVATLVAGAVPAIRGARAAVFGSLHSGDGASAEAFRGPRSSRWRDALLATEAAFASLLLIGAALFAHSLIRLTHVDAGYTADRVLTARVQLPRGTAPGRTEELIDRVLETARSFPGTIAAGAGTMMPLLPMTAMTSFTVAGAAPGEGPIHTRQITYVVTPGYAEALSLRLRQGRLFNDADVGAGVRPMIVNDEFVRRYFPHAPVLERRFRNLYPSDPPIETEIVGVVGSVLKDGNDRRPEPEVYFVHGIGNRQIGNAVNFVVRTSSDPSRLAGALRRVVHDTDRTATIAGIEPLADRLATSVAQPRFATTVLLAFAGTALVLASIGLYGVLAHAVSQRRRELGVRAALGASPLQLLSLVAQEGLWVTLAGLVAGLAAAAVLTRFMRAALFGISPLDPMSFVVAPAILFAVAIVACLRPGINAASVDPARALRAE
jgi:putative ABC transport system permease protein